MYHPELEIKDTTESNTSASYLDLHLSIGRVAQLRIFLYDKRDNFNFQRDSSFRKFYGRYGDLTKQYEAPLSRMWHGILDDQIQWHPTLKRHYINFWSLLIWTLFPNLTFYLIVQGFHGTYATGAACQQRTLTPPDPWSVCSNVETNISWTCLFSGLLNFEQTLGTSYLLWILLMTMYMMVAK